MKLLTKTTLYFLLVMMLLLTAGGYLLFRQLNKQINERADKELVYEELQWIQYLEAATASGSNFVLRSPDLLIYPTEEASTRYPQLSTVSGNKGQAAAQIPFRQLAHVVDVNGITYQIVIRKSQEQKLALVSGLTWILFFGFVCLFVATLLFNWLLSKRLWQPFRNTLQKIRNLELQKLEAVRFEKTNVREFTELNTALNSMTLAVYNEYLNVKEFTEDAAHEMQTPLAVAQAKLELLLQDPALKQAQAEAVAEASSALNRLGKLNQSLLLLAKIENHQYEAQGLVSLVDVAKKYLRLFDEIIHDKGVDVETHFSDDYPVALHPFLADSLVSNLIGNAIRYNRKGGKISITATAAAFCIANTSELPAIAPQRLFKRFKTTADASDTSNGLGLALVKKIADRNGLLVQYSHSGDTHRFCIKKATT